jgi:hypothetical protein
MQVPEKFTATEIRSAKTRLAAEVAFIQNLLPPEHFIWPKPLPPYWRGEVGSIQIRRSCNDFFCAERVRYEISLSNPQGSFWGGRQESSPVRAALIAERFADGTIPGEKYLAEVKCPEPPTMSSPGSAVI